MESNQNQNKKILIIKSQKQSFAAAEHFLNNRGWKIFSTDSLKEALSYLTQDCPDFVFVSVDHPNKKIQALPKVLVQAFPVCVMLFAENNSAISFKMLSDSGNPYLFYPPITGPAVERTINRYYKDLTAKANSQNEANKREAFESAEDSLMSIRGSNKSSLEFRIDIHTQKLLDQMVVDEEGSSGPHHLGASQDAPRMTRSQGTPAPGNLMSMSSAQGQGHWAPQEELKKPTEDLATTYLSQAADENESILLQGTRDALEKSVHITSLKEDQAIQKIEISTHVACIIIESVRFSGYLITALGKNRKIDAVFLKTISERLLNFLKSRGELVKLEDSISLKITEVPFEDWAMECAEFLRKSVHKGDEVAMAFFPYSETKVKLQDSPVNEMAAVHLKDLEPDGEVEMDLYLYLPTNQKYFLYTPRGGILYGAQKDRLSEKGITHMHIMKKDEEDLTKYRAQNYLNGKVDEYEQKKKNPPAPGKKSA